MSTELITMDANGQRYSQWKSIQVVQGGGRAVTEFAIETTEVTAPLESPFAKWNFPPNTAVELRAHRRGGQAKDAGDLLCRGIIDEYAPSGYPQNHNVRVTGTTPSVDIVDSSPDHPTGTFEDQNML